MMQHMINRGMMVDIAVDCMRARTPYVNLESSSVNRIFIEGLVEGLCSVVERWFAQLVETMTNPSSATSVEMIERAVLLLAALAQNKVSQEG